VTVRDDWKPAFFWIVGILIAISITATTWTLTTAAANEGRLDVIEDAKFTKSDATELEIRLLKEIISSTDAIKDCLNYIQQGRACP
jgi:hypothetical protein